MRTDPVGIEKLIQDAQKEGKFDDLANKGQPLDVGFGDLASVANDVFRGNGIIPEWIELSREIERLRARQEELVAGLERRRAGDRVELDQALTAWDPARMRAREGWRGLVRRCWLGERGNHTRSVSQPPGVVERIEHDRRRTLLQYADLVRTEHKKVDRYNLVSPLDGRQMRRVRVEERLLEFQARFPSLTLAESDGAWRLHERSEPVDASLLAAPEASAAARRQRSSEQAEALNALRAGRRKPPAIG